VSHTIAFEDLPFFLLGSELPTTYIKALPISLEGCPINLFHSGSSTFCTRRIKKLVLSRSVSSSRHLVSLVDFPLITHFSIKRVFISCPSRTENAHKRLHRSRARPSLVLSGSHPASLGLARVLRSTFNDFRIPGSIVLINKYASQLYISSQPSYCAHS
jgi:hypothetical protein